MKIRSDFVTNSSSSSYCVSLSVHTIDKNEIELDLYPEYEDGSGCIYISLKSDIHSILENIKSCTSVKELKQTLFEAISLGEVFEDILSDTSQTSNSDILEKLKELIDDDDEDEEYYTEFAKEVQEKIHSFLHNMDNIRNLSEIKNINIYESFTGWGEFARDGVEDFITCALPVGSDIGDGELITEFFDDKLAEEELEALLDQVENDSICSFQAGITTTLSLSDGKVTKQYQFEDFS